MTEGHLQVKYINHEKKSEGTNLRVVSGGQRVDTHGGAAFPLHICMLQSIKGWR